MATDYNILETELTVLKHKLKRDLHMHGVHRLSKKQFDLAKSVVQRRQIENLSNQVAELQPTARTVYCPQYALKDNEIKGYLVYLLQMKDHFAREAATKNEMINQREAQIKAMTRKLCAVTNENAKMKRSIPVKSPEFVRLENMSDRMNQMNKRICSMRQENKKIMENIKNMRIFQRQFKTFERDFHSRISYLKNEAQGRLSTAVATYEEKDEFMNRERVLKERCSQELRKAAINENALNLCLVRTEKNDIFAKLQDTIRTDARVAETGDMIEKGITGIEPTLEGTQDLHSAIVDAAGQQTPENMEENFKLKDDNTNSLFSYLDELLKDIHHLHGNIDQLRSENNELMKSTSESDRKMKREIKINQDAAQTKLEEAERVIKEKDEARCEVDSLLENVKSLYAKFCPDDVASLQERPIDDSNAIDYLQNMEKQILDYLMCVEYIRMQEASKEDRPPLVLETKDDEDEDDATSKLETLPPVQPRELQSVCDLSILMEMEQEESFLEFEELKKMAVAVVTEMTSEKSRDEDEDKKSVTSENK